MLALASVLVGSLIGAAIPVSPSAAASPVLTLDLATASFGSPVTLYAEHLDADALYQVVWDGSSAGQPQGRSDGQGTLRVAYRVPAAASGPHTIGLIAVAGGPASNPVASATLTVADAGATAVAALPFATMPTPTETADPTAAPTVAATHAPVVRPAATPRPAPRPTPRPASTPWSVAFLARKPSGPIVISGRSNVVISGKQFVNLGAGVSAIRIEHSHHVTITANDFKNVAEGIMVLDSTDVVITWNRYENITGPHERTGANVGNFTQWEASWGGEIYHNKGIGGDTEDIVSLYRSGGSPAAPLLVANNQFQGTNWSSGSGSGMMLGDAGGAYITVRDNILVSPGQVGIGVPGGSHIRILDNILYGARRSASNVGIYVWNQSGSPCSSIEVAGNRVLWTKADGVDSGGWDGGGCGTVAGWGNNDWHAALNPSALAVHL
jgi:hypothetical protein